MRKKKFARLIRREILTERELDAAIEEAGASGKHPEELLIEKGVPKHEVLFCLSECYGFPFVEFDEGVAASYFITMRLDLEKHKRALWFPLSVRQGRAEVIAYDPGDPSVAADVKATLGVSEISFLVALPSDIVRIIEHSFDVNPRFPHHAGRTPLAKVRTYLADRRSLFAWYRTSLAKGRTGLAFLRTGISFMAIALVLLRVFGFGYLSIFEAGLFISGLFMTADGVRWYIPARKAGVKLFRCAPTEPTWGTTSLRADNPGNNVAFTRTGPVEEASELRAGWNNLSPVMRRRFLANDRTDFAEERTYLACYRSTMARARTGLAFTRTGIASIGFGIALLRQFHAGYWTILDISLIAMGIAMAMEGFHWYVPGHRAGRKGFEAVRKNGSKMDIWDFVLPSLQRRPGLDRSCPPFLEKSCVPGIWATTGHALERTLLADRRNLMARLRTVMARSRTGMAFIRTGMSIASVGMGLLVYFGTGNPAWTAFDAVLIAGGLAFILDGLYWHVPAENLRRQFPYCYGDMEIVVPDYGVPNCKWGKAVFSHDNT
ncbi:MAG TPA: DUF202 domain-containing protein [Dissulfurispiraceae bacterium]